MKGTKMTLSEYMEKNSTTDQKMSDEIGVSRSAITQYRNGVRMPKPEIALEIYRVTKGKVSPTDFLKGLKRVK